jgi:hypothetical protein
MSKFLLHILEIILKSLILKKTKVLQTYLTLTVNVQKSLMVIKRFYNISILLLIQNF